ncbi:MAG: hypothetical protein AVDCRST_MAG09-1609, partial [uncultured Sphingomonas sp.]
GHVHQERLGVHPSTDQALGSPCRGTTTIRRRRADPCPRPRLGRPDGRRKLQSPPTRAGEMGRGRPALPAAGNAELPDGDGRSRWFRTLAGGADELCAGHR